MLSNWIQLIAVNYNCYILYIDRFYHVRLMLLLSFCIPRLIRNIWSHTRSSNRTVLQINTRVFPSQTRETACLLHAIFIQCYSLPTAVCFYLIYSNLLRKCPTNWPHQFSHWHWLQKLHFLFSSIAKFTYLFYKDKCIYFVLINLSMFVS